MVSKLIYDRSLLLPFEENDIHGVETTALNLGNDEVFD